MNQPEFDPRLETRLRRRLTAPEQAALDTWLDAHPAVRRAWAEEEALWRVLGALPDAPVSPGFAARVRAEAERGSATVAPPGWPWSRRWGSLLQGWRGAVAGIAVLVLAVGLSWHQHARERARLAESVAAMATLAELPDLEALAEFEVVYHLPTGPLPDAQELARAFE